MKSQSERPKSGDQLFSGADPYGLDDLRMQNPADNTMSQQSSLIIEALRTELHPKKINLLMGLVLEERAIERRKADYDTVFRKMSEGIYFFSLESAEFQNGSQWRNSNFGTVGKRSFYFVRFYSR